MQYLSPVEIPWSCDNGGHWYKFFCAVDSNSQHGRLRNKNSFFCGKPLQGGPKWRDFQPIIVKSSTILWKYEMMGTCLQLCHSESSLLQARCHWILDLWDLTDLSPATARHNTKRKNHSISCLRETKRQVQILHARTAGALRGNQKACAARERVDVSTNFALWLWLKAHLESLPAFRAKPICG